MNPDPLHVPPEPPAVRCLHFRLLSEPCVYCEDRRTTVLTPFVLGLLAGTALVAAAQVALMWWLR